MSDAPLRDTPAFARELSTTEQDEPLPSNWEERQVCGVDSMTRMFFIEKGMFWVKTIGRKSDCIANLCRVS